MPAARGWKNLPHRRGSGPRMSALTSAGGSVIEDPAGASASVEAGLVWLRLRFRFLLNPRLQSPAHPEIAPDGGSPPTETT